MYSIWEATGHTVRFWGSWWFSLVDTSQSQKKQLACMLVIDGIAHETTLGDASWANILYFFF